MVTMRPTTCIRQFFVLQLFFMCIGYYSDAYNYLKSLLYNQELMMILRLQIIYFKTFENAFRIVFAAFKKLHST